MSKISSLTPRIIHDSRGDEAVAVDLRLDDDREISASVPQGKSRGSHEAVSVSAEMAAENIREVIAPAFLGENLLEQEKLDEKLIKLDGTEDKSSLGANALLVVSIALARAGALSLGLGIPLWKYLRSLSGIDVRGGVPRLYINVINGGAHAENNLDFQEYLIIPKGESINESAGIGRNFCGVLGNYLRQRFKNVDTGDEGGFSLDFKDSLEPFTVLKEAAMKIGLLEKLDFGIDAAATNIEKSAGELFPIYEQMNKEFGLFYLEDPFEENDFKNFAKLKKTLGEDTLIVGDDLTTTNVGLMEKARDAESVNGVIIKPNQIGTVTETLKAIKFAKEQGWATIVSHRSGETEDDFIADLAYGVGADGIKIGAPVQKERLAKYSRLQEIEGR